MGMKLKSIIIRKELDYQDLIGKIVAMSYSHILTLVQEEIKNEKNLSIETFEKIVRWKAERNYNNIIWKQFEIYSEAITDVIKFQGYKKV